MEICKENRIGFSHHKNYMAYIFNVKYKILKNGHLLSRAQSTYTNILIAHRLGVYSWCLIQFHWCICLSWKRSGFHSNPKERQCQKCSNYCTVALISHTSKVMLKILQARFNSTWTMNFQMFKLVLEKAEEPEIKLPTSAGSSKKKWEFQKNICFCFINYAKAFDCVDHNKLWKILKEMGIPDHLTCLLISVCRSRSNS